MTCYESPTIEPGQTWSSFHANITLHSIIDGTHADITVLPYQGDADRFTITEDLTYEYPDAVRPFSLVMQTIIAGTITQGVVKCVTCDMEVTPPEPPSDLLGLLTYVKDKVIEIITTVTAIVLTLTDIDGLIQGAQIRIDEAKNLVTGLQSHINYELDVLEIWLSDQFNSVISGIITPMELYKTDILEAISTISTIDPGEILEEIRTEIVQMGNNLSNKIIEDLWNYIESKIFEER